MTTATRGRRRNNSLDEAESSVSAENRQQLNSSLSCRVRQRAKFIVSAAGQRYDAHRRSKSRTAIPINTAISETANMVWTKRLLITLPFGIAAVLNVLMLSADRLHLQREHVAGFGFLFATPWAWLLERGWFGSVHGRWVMVLLGYMFILWIPAALYSCCLCLLFVAFKTVAAHRAR